MDEVWNAAALFDQGNLLFEAGNAAAAADAFARCHALAPDHAGALYNLGNSLVLADRPVEAADAYIACLRRAPGMGKAHASLAAVLRELSLLDQAQTMAEAAVQYLPADPAALLCLANVLFDQAEYERSAALYRQVLAADPGDAGALSNLGNALRTLGHLPDALAAHDRAVALAPDRPQFRYNRAVALLASGDFRRGWDDHESRWQAGRLPPDGLGPHGLGPPWRGEDITGRTILLHAEQGLGDTLQFVRYAPMVAARGARVVLRVQPPLLRLIRNTMRFAQVVAAGDDLPPFDAHCPLLSLPLAFGTTLETIPAAAPYLAADPAAVADWGRRLPDDGGLRVGLVWAGSPHANDAGAHLIDRRRSISPALLAPLAGVPGVRWVSLQKDPTVPPPACLEAIDPMPEVGDFADTAALVANLDLVVSVDTSVAHLAGGMGVPVWLLSRYDGCWRWLQDRTDTPWYPGMRIYRQERPGDWPRVVARIRSDLLEAAAGLGCDAVAPGG